MLKQVFCNVIQYIPVFFQQLFRCIIAFFQDHLHFLINLCRCIVSAVEYRSAIQIPVFHRFQTDQSKFSGHAVLRYHRTRNLRCLFNIVGSACCNRMENDLFRGTARHKRNKTRFQLFFRHQIFFFFRNLHHIAKRTHCTRHNCDFLYRLGIFLQCCRQRMAHLMVSDNPFFLLAEYPVFFLFSCNDHFDRFK